MGTKKYVICAVAILFGSANIYNILQGAETTGSVNQFITLSSGDPNGNYTQWDPQREIEEKGDSQPIELTCYVVECAYLPAPWAGTAELWNEYYSNEREQRERAIDIERGRNKYANCQSKPARMFGQKCSNSNNYYCHVINCSNTDQKWQ